MSIRILIADDHGMVREGLRALIESERDMEVVAEAVNGRIAVQLAADLNPHIVIMDVGMPDMNGIEATRRIRSRTPESRVIALSMHADRRFVREMLDAGASGYLLKESVFKELTEAIHYVVGGKTYLSPMIAGEIVDDYILMKQEESPSSSQRLTPREHETLQLIAEGYSTKEASGKLGVSVKTIETYRQNIMQKLGLYSIAELTKYAIREGLTSLEK